MPTSSQAKLMMTDKKDDPRRYVPTSVPSLPSINRGYTDCLSKTNSLTLMAANKSGLPDVDVHGNSRAMLVKDKTERPGWQVTTKNLKPTVVSEEMIFNRTMEAFPKATNSQHTAAVHLSHEEHQLIRENLGFRRRQMSGGSVLTETSKPRSRLSSVTIPRGAKYTPTPPGTKPIPLTSPSISTVNTGSFGDVCSDSSTQIKRSLLEKLKETISYDNRLVPSMEFRKSLPPPSPNTVVFSLRNGEDYRHKDIKILIESKSGLKPRSIQYDPVNVRVGSSDILGRWIVQFGCPEETHCIVHTGLEVNGEKIIVRLLDDVHKMEVEAYKLKMEEERKRTEREAKMQVLKTRKRTKANCKRGGRVRV